MMMMMMMMNNHEWRLYFIVFMVFITIKSPLGAMLSPCSNHVAQIHIGFPAFLQFGGPFGAVGLLGLPNCCPGHGLVTSSCHILLYGERVPPGKLNMNFKMDTVSETRIDISQNIMLHILEIQC